MYKDYFLILQVHYLASDEVIKAAYKRLCQIHHPDQGGKRHLFHDLQEAYESLMDPKKKADYMKVWMKFNIHEEKFHMDELKDSFYNITLFHIKKILIEYLEAIRDGDFEGAYGYISHRNQKHLYLKDFVNWQRAIGQVHQILDFECFIKQVHGSDHHQPEIRFRVKVKEYNQVLNRVEEDFFDRVLVYEDNQWRVKLNHFDVKSVIKKYKKISALNKKNKKQFHRLLPSLEEGRTTKFVSKRFFISNCDYEYLRFKRYKNVFSILSVEVTGPLDSHLLEETLAMETRDTDSFCLFDKNHYYILLPETLKSAGSTVANKISSALRGKTEVKLKYKISQVNERYESIKEMLDRLKA